MKVLTSPKVAKPIRRKFADVEAFEKWAFQQELGYEFTNGDVFKKNMIKEAELLIIWFLNQLFKKTNLYSQGSELLSEVGMRLSTGSFRIPDLSFFTAQQHLLASRGERIVSEFVIEILSNSESAQHIADKISDYFASGVKVVWYIYPETETIYVYTSPKNIQVCNGDDVVSAAPVVPDYTFPAKEIFRKELALS
ncbi:MAG: Uma2 family endonuclease [Pyrinomonadaceae bacterium]|nr:Uma2 family endonuclease [Pyrinomonadaceae bacterium]